MHGIPPSFDLRPNPSWRIPQPVGEIAKGKQLEKKSEAAPAGKKFEFLYSGTPFVFAAPRHGWDTRWPEGAVHDTELGLWLFCSTAAMLLEHGSEFLPQVIKLCIDVCETCTAENERSDLRPCRQAAEACRCFVRECRKTNAI